MNDPASAQDKPELEPRERILDAAEDLFAQKGYSAVGVRELAAQAGVNIAMISYYFGSKQGVLEELINRFFELYEQVATEALGLELEPRERFRRFVEQVLALFAARPQLVRIAMTELPLDAIDVARFKAERIRRFVDCLHAAGKCDPPTERDPQLAAIRGPAIIAVLTSHFLMKPVLEQMQAVSFDGAFYRKLPTVLADLLSAGLQAVAAGEQAGRYAKMSE